MQEPEDTIKRPNVESMRDYSRREPGAIHTVAGRLGADASAAGHQPVGLGWGGSSADRPE